MDPALRHLERMAKTGDPVARQQYDRAVNRLGLARCTQLEHLWQQLGPVGTTSLKPWTMAVACKRCGLVYTDFDVGFDPPPQPELVRFASDMFSQGTVTPGKRTPPIFMTYHYAADAFYAKTWQRHYHFPVDVAQAGDNGCFFFKGLCGYQAEAGHPVLTLRSTIAEGTACGNCERARPVRQLKAKAAAGRIFDLVLDRVTQHLKGDVLSEIVLAECEEASRG